MATSKNSTGKKNFYFSILDYIKDNNKLPDLSISKQAMNYYVSKLKLEGIIYKLGYGVWGIDIDKYKDFRFGKTSKNSTGVSYGNKAKKKFIYSNKIRGHGFHFTLKLPKIPNWHKREDFLKKRNIMYTQLGNNWQGQRIYIKQCKVWLTNKSIVIYFPKGLSFYSASADNSKFLAINYMYGIIRSIENKLSISLKVNGKYNFDVSKQHYARLNDEIANECNNQRTKIKCFYDGKLWCLTDASFNVNELETVEAKKSDIDMDKIIVPFLNDLKDHKVTTGETLLVSDMLKVIHAQNEQIKTLSMSINSLLYTKPDPLDIKDNYFG